MKKIYKLLILNIAILLVVSGCQKWDNFKSFIPEGEKIYPGIDTGVTYRAGNKRGLLAWPSSPDQRVAKYLVSWNNNSKSLSIDAASHNPKDSVKVLVENLEEGFYTFIIKSSDNIGNQSVAVEKNNVRVYGPNYQKSLLNRIVSSVQYNAQTKEVTVDWSAPENGNTETEIRYMSKTDVQIKTKLKANDSRLILNDLKSGAKIYYQSYFRPTPTAIDVFSALQTDSITVKGN
jgi:Domain of unknown function